MRHLLQYGHVGQLIRRHVEYRVLGVLNWLYHQRVTVCGLIIVSRSHLQQNGQPMKFISICDRTGIVECEIFAAAYRAYGLATVRYPIVQVTAEVKPFDNAAGYTLEVLRVERTRT